MSKKLGSLIKEARTKKELSQAELAERVEGLSAAALGKAERGEAEPPEEIVRAIAKELGVTQVSLVEAMSKKGTAAKSGSSKTSSAKSGSSKTSSAKSSSSKTSSAKSGSSKTSSAKSGSSKTSSAKSGSSKTSSAKSGSGTSVKLTATQKQLLDLYAKADSDTKKAVMALLKGEPPKTEDIVGTLLESTLNMFMKK